MRFGCLAVLSLSVCLGAQDVVPNALESGDVPHHVRILRGGRMLSPELLQPGGEEGKLTPSGPLRPLGFDPFRGPCDIEGSSQKENGETPEGDSPSRVVYSPDGSTLFVAHRESRNVIAYDAATHAFLYSVEVSGSPNGLAITPDGLRAVTANIFEDSVSILDLVTQTETDVVPVGSQPAVVRISPDGLRAAVGLFADQELSVIDLNTATETHRIAGLGMIGTLSVAPESGAIAFVPAQFEFVDASTVMHPDFFGNSIDFFDVVAGTVNSVPSADSPQGLDVAPDGLTAVVAHGSTAQTISVVDPVAQTISKTIATGVDLRGPIAMNPAATQAVVHVLNNSRMVDLVTDVVGPNLSTASLSALYTTADGLYVLGVGFRGSLISFASGTIVKDLNNLVSTNLGAVSPTAARGALAATTFGEDLLFLDTNGAAGSVELAQMTGPAGEADKTRRLALTPDGTRAVTTNVLSDTASIIHVSSGVVEAIVQVGNRPSGVAITPDGLQAVVTNLDSTFASVIDLVTYGVTDVPISTRGSEVEISPDGSFAYVAVVSSGDGVWRIDLSSLTTSGPKLLTGNMGGVGFFFNQSSGITLSNDGATLAVCGSFDDVVTLIDTGSWSILTNVPVGDFPVRAAFAPDDGEIYVTNRNSDNLSVIQNAGAGSSVSDTIAVGDSPFRVLVHPSGAPLFVANASSATVGVVDVAAGAQVDTIAVNYGVQGLALNETGSCLYATGGSSSVSFFSITLAGGVDLIDTVKREIVASESTDQPPGELVYDPWQGRAVITTPYVDGLTVISEP